MAKSARERSRSRVVVVGSVNTDMVVHVGHLPRPGETVLGGEFLTAQGGKGANQAVAAARLGAAVTCIARVGADALGEQSIAELTRHGVDIEHVGKDRVARSGVALVLVSAEGENSIAVASGANGKLSPAHLRRAAKAFQGGGIFLAQLETPLDTIRVAIDLARRSDMTVILNPAPAKKLPRELLQKVSILTPNESEAELMTGIGTRTESGVVRAAEALRRIGIPTVIITRGSRGVLVASGDTQQKFPAYKVDAIDTTGAGDVFNGALAVALSEGRRLHQAVRFANAAAAISVTRRGAQQSAPTRVAVERLLRLQS